MRLSEPRLGITVLKYLPDNIINALKYIFNLSLCQGKFVLLDTLK